MILDHEWMAAAAGLVEHSPGILTSIGSIVLYALLRDGIPYYKRRRNGNPGNPGSHAVAERLLACEKAINRVKESCTRSETLWEGQKDFNARMEKHIGNIYEKFDKVAGG